MDPTLSEYKSLEEYMMEKPLKTLYCNSLNLSTIFVEKEVLKRIFSLQLLVKLPI